MIRINPFPILLNNLSNELEDKDLQSLKNVCAEFIPGGQREKIKIGWDVFNILLRQNVIGSESEKMANLLAIIKELKRRDLIHMIKKHIQEYYEQPEMVFNLIASTVDSSGPKLTYTRNQLSDEQRPSTPACCVQDWCCCKLTCYKSPCCDLPCCCIVLAVLFTLLTIVAILAWYADIPEVTRYLNSTNDLRKAGPYIVAALAFFALFSGLCRCYYHFRSTRSDQPDPMLSSSQENNQVICSRGSYTASNSVNTTPVLTRDDSFQSNPVTASCSLSSIASQLPHISESETVPDVLQKYKGDEEKFYTPVSSTRSSRNVSSTYPEIQSD